VFSSQSIQWDFVVSSMALASFLETFLCSAIEGVVDNVVVLVCFIT